MIVPLPPRASNDNEPQQYWTCYGCGSGAFLLEWNLGTTLIRCAECRIDITKSIVPELNQCQP